MFVTVLKLLYEVEEIIKTVFEPEALSTYVPYEDGKPHIPGFPQITTSNKSYASTLIDLSGGNPQEEPQAHFNVPVQSTKRRYTGKPKDDILSSLPANFASKNKEAVKMTEALNETTTRLKMLESNDKYTKETLKTVTERLEIQGKAILQQKEDISKLGETIVNQRNLISAIQENQLT